MNKTTQNMSTRNPHNNPHQHRKSKNLNIDSDYDMDSFRTTLFDPKKESTYKPNSPPPVPECLTRILTIESLNMLHYEG